MDFENGPKADLPTCSEEDRRLANQYFQTRWGPYLKEHGFVRRKTAWWRIYHNSLLQGISFNVQLRRKYINCLDIRYNLWPLFVNHCSAFPPAFIHLQQELTDYTYLGIETPLGHYTHIPYIVEDGYVKRGEPKEYVVKCYRSAYYALRDIKSALDSEFQLFCERTLPIFDTLTDALTYAEWAHNHSWIVPGEEGIALSPGGVDTQLIRGKWDCAEKSLLVCLNREEKMGLHTSGRKWFYNLYTSMLERVRQRDGEWLKEHLRENELVNWQTIKHWFPELYRKYEADASILRLGISTDLGE